MSRQRRKPESDQYQLDYSSRERERGLLLARLDDLGRSAAASRVRYLVELVAIVAGDGELRWTNEQLGRRLCLPERTMRRTVELAEGTGILRAARLKRPDKTWGVTALSVAWDVLASRSFRALPEEAAVAQDESSGTPERPTGPPGRSDRPRRPEGVARQAGRSGQPGRSPDPLHPPIDPPPPLPPDASDGSPSRSGSPDWPEVVVVVAGLINEAEDACRKARLHGLTPQQVLAIVEHYRPHDAATRAGGVGGWQSPGILRYRISTGRPDWEAEDRWPPRKAEPAEVVQARERAAAAHEAKARAAAQRAAIEREQAEAAAEQAAIARRERQLGPVLDALDARELAELLTALPAFARECGGQARPLEGLCRTEALELLERREAAKEVT